MSQFLFIFAKRYGIHNEKPKESSIVIVINRDRQYCY